MDAKKLRDEYEKLLESVPEGTEIWIHHLDRVNYATFPSYALHVVKLNSEWAHNLSDQELINICDSGPFNFGGRVERFGKDRATVTVYTD